HAFSANKTHFAVAYARTSGTTTTRSLRILPRAGGAGSTLDAKTISTNFIPVDIAENSAGYLLVGNDEPAGSAKLAWVDAMAKVSETGTTSGRLAFAGALDTDGARTLARSGTGGSAKAVTDLYDAYGVLENTVDLGPLRRPVNHWDLAWRNSANRGVACGYTTSGPVDLLTVFELQGDTVTPRVTTHALAADPDPAKWTSRFACRIAMGPDFSAVAFVESDGRPRLIWLDSEGKILAGPAPFGPDYTSGAFPAFDVAISGDNTAVAFFDKSTGAARILVRVYSGPGFAPVDVEVSGDRNLGAFTTSRVRLVGLDDGFSVAYDAAIGTTRTDILYRDIGCTP
ncbi:MAG: hypothetical protein ACK4N5_10390, partial [Myxococcales bacterium]